MLFHVHCNINFVIFPSFILVFLNICIYLRYLSVLLISACIYLYPERFFVSLFFSVPQFSCRAVSFVLLPPFFLFLPPFRCVPLLHSFLFITFLLPTSFPFDKYILGGQVRELWLH
jgi:hypothetical protein